MKSAAAIAWTCGLALASGSVAAQDQDGVLTGTDAFGGWQQNRIGIQRLIRPADLPPPNATRSASNSPGVVARPEGVMPKVPASFKVELVATGIDNPRAIRFAPNGDLFVANSADGSVLRYAFHGGAAKPATQTIFVSGLRQPYGIAFYPIENPNWIYIAESTGLRRYPYKAGDSKAEGGGQQLFEDIDPTHHWTRDVAFSDDGATMYYSVGSGSNVGETTMTRAPKGGLAQWQTGHALGVAWGGEQGRAAVLALDPDGTNRRYFATGIRNCSGMTIQPQTGELWCAVNERDGLGDNLPPDYATHVADGGFYGWPWFYVGDHLDPRWRGHQPDIGDKVTVPDVLFQAHSAPLNIAFYTAGAFGPAYENQAFVTMHGSWNRGTPTGYKVVELEIDKSGKATGVYQDFMTGFVTDNGEVWGRPVGVAVSPDGALFVSDDGSGSIWKVSRR